MLSWLTSRKDSSHHSNGNGSSNNNNHSSSHSNSSFDAASATPDKQHNRRMANALNTPRNGRGPGRRGPLSAKQLQQEQSDDISVSASRNGIEMSLSQDNDLMNIATKSSGKRGSGDSTTTHSTPDDSVMSQNSALLQSHQVIPPHLLLDPESKLCQSWINAVAVRGKSQNSVFDVAHFPLLPLAAANSSSASPSSAFSQHADWQRRRHRVPLMPKKLFAPQQQPAQQSKSNLLFGDVLFLLRAHQVQDEATAVREELVKLNEEMGELQKDKERLEATVLNLPAATTTTTTNNTNNNDNGAATREWDVYRALALPTPLPAAQQQALQLQRGTNWIVSLGAKQQQQQSRNSNAANNNNNNANNSALEALLKCLGSSVNKATKVGDYCWTMNNRGLAVAHACLWKSSKNSIPAFFLSRDQQLSSHHGLWPDKLLARIKMENFEFTKQQDFTYLSLGDWDQYFGILRSGETWWGTVDADLDAILKDWDCHRVAFGPSQRSLDPIPVSKNNSSSSGNVHYHTSWVVVARDGRVAWKHVPARLAGLFNSRLATQAGVAEVSLGAAGAYFVRFLDGTMHYSLPAHIANACRRMEQQGHTITNVILHSELPHDFIIRSSSSLNSSSSKR